MEQDHFYLRSLSFSYHHYICQRIPMIGLAVFFFMCNDLGCLVVVVSMVEDGVGSLEEWLDSTGEDWVEGTWAGRSG